MSNPTLADQVAIEPEYRIYRDAGIVLTQRGTAKADAKGFAAYLASADDAKIFASGGGSPRRRIRSSLLTRPDGGNQPPAGPA